MGFLVVMFLLIAAAAGIAASTSKKKSKAASRPVARPVPEPYADVSKPPPSGATSYQLTPVQPSPTVRFCSRKPLTDREQGCYYRLIENLGGDFIVLPQVAFSAFLRTEGGSEKENFREFARMRQKVADFLICRKDFSIVALIELDDKSHVGKEEKDKERDTVVKEAGIRVFRIPATPGNDAVRNLGEVLRRLNQVTA